MKLVPLTNIYGVQVWVNHETIVSAHATTTAAAKYDQHGLLFDKALQGYNEEEYIWVFRLSDGREFVIWRQNADPITELKENSMWSSIFAVNLWKKQFNKADDPDVWLGKPTDGADGITDWDEEDDWI